MSAEIETLHVPFERELRKRNIEFIRARSDCASTIEAGWPDFTMLHPRRPALLIEFKDKDTPTSDKQKKVHQRLTERGFAVHVVRALDVAFELLEAWLGDVRAEPIVATAQDSKMTIRKHGDRGDWLFLPTGEPYRKATFADYALYERKD